MEAVALPSGVMRPRVVVVKTLASALTIGSGGSVGREGPIVQIGAALGSTIGQWLKVSGRRLRTLVGCGAAAGIAATFNAPVAGAIFSLEVILGDLGVSRFSPIVVSSGLATVVSRHFLGNTPAFDVPPHGLVSVWELGIYGVLGVAAAGVALAVRRSTSRSRVGWGSPCSSPSSLVKLLATSITLGSGGSGGVFAPSLFLGAMTGGAIGVLANLWFPGVTAGSGAYALVGMGAVVAGTTHAPITAILIIFELTSDYTLLLPLMASVIIATGVTRAVRPDSIYTLNLLRRGVDVFKGRELNVLKALTVDGVMSRDVPRVGEGEPLARMIDAMSETRSQSLYVTDDDGHYVGRVDVPDIRAALVDAEALSGLVLAGDLAREDGTIVAPGERLDIVMRIFAGHAPNELAVVEPQTGRLAGVVGRRHLLDAYNHELLERDMVSGMGDAVASAESHQVQLGSDSRMIEVDAPGPFTGYALPELDVRSRYGVQILLVRRPAGPDSEDRIEVVPGPDTVLRRGDRLPVVGTDKAFAALSRW